MKIKPKKIQETFFCAFPIAGLSYYEGALVFPRLKIGTKLKLKAEPSNRHDENAIVLTFEGHKIGYIPRSHNKELSILMNAGYNLFRARILQIDPDEHPAKQIRVAVFVKHRFKKKSK